jgi:hypothetical protein
VRRRNLVIGITATGLLLALPVSAGAATRTVAGDFAGDTSATSSLIFKAKGKVNSKGRFIPRRVRDFEASTTYTCFNQNGNPGSTKNLNDLAPGFFNGLRVNKKGFFSGSAVTPTGITYTVDGRIRKGKAHGSLAATQGQKGSNDYCSTGTFNEPALLFTAKLIPPACSGAPNPGYARKAACCVGWRDCESTNADKPA